MESNEKEVSKDNTQLLLPLVDIAECAALGFIYFDIDRTIIYSRTAPQILTPSADAWRLNKMFGIKVRRD